MSLFLKRQCDRTLGKDTARVFIWDLFPDTGDDCELKLSSGKVVKVRTASFDHHARRPQRASPGSHRRLGGGRSFQLRAGAGRR